MGLFGSKERESINWTTLDRISLLDELDTISKEQDVLLFKHSTRCSISTMALRRLESAWDKVNEQIIPVYLDLLRFRDISNEIASRYGVIHQSPQLLLIRDGKCLYDASHSMISIDELKKNL